MGIPTKLSAHFEGIRTAFWEEPGHQRSDGGISIVQELFGFVKRKTYPEPAEDYAAGGETDAANEEAALVRASVRGNWWSAAALR